MFCDKFCVFAGLDIPAYLFVSVRLLHVCLRRTRNKKTLKKEVCFCCSLGRLVKMRKFDRVFKMCQRSFFSLSRSGLVFQLVLSFNKKLISRIAIR